MMNVKLLTRISNWKRFLNNKSRSFKTSSTVRGGAGGASHGHGAGEHYHFDTNWLERFLRRFIKPEKAELQGYLYRELGNIEGSIGGTVSKIGPILAWWWITYMIYKHPEDLWGHMEYPVISRFTDEELGMPPADS